MLSKLWATYEMNFWERKIHRALECNLTFLTRHSRRSVAKCRWSWVVGRGRGSLVWVAGCGCGCG